LLLPFRNWTSGAIKELQKQREGFVGTKEPRGAQNQARQRPIALPFWFAVNRTAKYRGASVAFNRK
jgi:hypothetical protein